MFGIGSEESNKNDSIFLSCIDPSWWRLLPSCPLDFSLSILYTQWKTATWLDLNFWMTTVFCKLLSSYIKSHYVWGDKFRHFFWQSHVFEFTWIYNGQVIKCLMLNCVKANVFTRVQYPSCPADGADVPITSIDICRFAVTLRRVFDEVCHWMEFYRHLQWNISSATLALWSTTRLLFQPLNI